jgi:hypothetical protein
VGRGVYMTCWSRNTTDVQQLKGGISCAAFITREPQVWQGGWQVGNCSHADHPLCLRLSCSCHCWNQKGRPQPVNCS